MTKEIESWEDKYSTMEVEELAKAQKALTKKHETQKGKATLLQKELDYVRLNVLPEKMADRNITSMNITGVGRLTLSGDIYAKTEDKEALYKWLVENDLKDLIKGTVNAGTLKAEIRRRMKAGESLPDSDIIKIKAFSRTSITSS